MNDELTNYTTGGNRISCYITDRTYTPVGDGPLQTCFDLTTTRRLSAAGEWQASFPDNDPATNFLELKSTLVRWYVDGVHVMTGPVEHMALALNERGERVLTVSGRDMLGELSEAPVGFLKIAEGDNPTKYGPSFILNVAGVFDEDIDWSLDVTDGYATSGSTAYASFAGESALTALTMLGDHIGEHFRSAKDGSRTLVWMRDVTPDSGVRAIGTASDQAHYYDHADITYIQQFGIERDGYELLTHIFPYGSGQGAARLDVYGATRVLPAGYSYGTSGAVWIQNDTAMAAFGRNLGRYVEFKDIRPLTDGAMTLAEISDAILSAKNQLVDAALAYMERNNSVENVTTYRLSVTHVPDALDVGTTVQVVYADDVYAVDTDLTVMEVRSRWGAGAAESHELVVTPVVRKLAGDADLIVGRMQEGKVFQAHPQQNVNAYTTGYRVYVGDSQANKTGEIRFWFGNEVMQIERVLLRFFVGAMTAPSQTVTAEAVTSGASSTSTTSSGGSSTPTSSSGGGSTPTSEQADGTVNHAHSLEVTQYSIDVGHVLRIDGTAGLTVNNGLSGSFNAGSTTLTSVQHTHDVEIADHTHTVSVPAHTHGMEHTHTVTPVLTTAFGVFKQTTNIHTINTLEYSINGSDYEPLAPMVDSLGAGWYALDLTSAVRDANRRPINEQNTLTIRCQVTSEGGGAAGMIDAFLRVREIIQGNYLT